ncbi:MULTISPECIES: LysR family transcriptional regulator [Streptomycetaceae]|uniref:Transcriptional regulator, LysR family protein n=1 Tax=Streptantibioticus cattleyicolor (strain ATCC 35852 / DSM 46488 / JCM 4925 / NBRC 14057 / NRRL 8057) TaxID=1003195 RepID=F8JQV9_STREN|nr:MULTISPECIES: LysR family transcriptional regulator [Streptomycetaceae]AEW92849.1 transcriptional regulator, LysR family protein [Streptantibioticus cattleyicolor NRRL 8057 = DSM 46488]MYS57604.1 LysR family transcriptional regulator [Streptomyces sp. SID5468]CCB73202.1 Transcriptional regulator, LysR family protein [Streptantibioticus cattleyicolor NRRL 8057 = DSM 46488]
MDVELRHLRAFVSVARHRSFSRAAEELLISQPALSRTIAQLEGGLDVRLLDRSSRHVEPTDTGAEFLVHAERVLATLDEALAVVSHRVTLRLGFSWLLPDPWAQRTVSRFEETTGASVALTRTDDPLHALRQRTVDIALVRGDVDAPRGARVVRLCDEQRVAVCSEHCDLVRLGHLDWTDVQHWPLVVNVVSGTTGPWSWPVDQRPARIIETTNYDEWLETVAADRGIGIVPDAARRRTRHPALRFVPLTNAPPSPVSLVHLPDTRPTLIRRFLEAAAR